MGHDLQSPADACGDGPCILLALVLASSRGSCSGLQVRSGSVSEPAKAVRTLQQTAVLWVVSDFGGFLLDHAGSMYMTPMPIKRHNPTLVRLPIWRFRRKIAGRAASMRSEMTERTVGCCG